VVRLSVCPSHSCALLKPLDGMRCRLAGMALLRRNASTSHAAAVWTVVVGGRSINWIASRGGALNDAFCRCCDAFGTSFSMWNVTIWGCVVRLLLTRSAND